MSSRAYNVLTISSNLILLSYEIKFSLNYVSSGGINYPSYYYLLFFNIYIYIYKKKLNKYKTCHKSNAITIYRLAKFTSNFIFIG